LYKKELLYYMKEGGNVKAVFGILSIFDAESTLAHGDRKALA
jgi:hypothetical protein